MNASKKRKLDDKNSVGICSQQTSIFIMLLIVLGRIRDLISPKLDFHVMI